MTEAGPPTLHLDEQYSIAVALWWLPPDPPGNITGYWITDFGDNKSSSTFVKAAPDDSIQRATICGLTPDTNYTFIVYAVNSKGTGQASLSLLAATLPGSIGNNLIKLLFRNIYIYIYIYIYPHNLPLQIVTWRDVFLQQIICTQKLTRHFRLKNYLVKIINQETFSSMSFPAGKPSSTLMTQNHSTGFVIGVAVGTSVFSAVIACFLTYLAVSRKQRYTINAFVICWYRNSWLVSRTRKGDPEQHNVEMNVGSYASGSAHCEEIDKVQTSSHTDVVHETLTVSALYASVTADNASDERMRNNPAYGQLSLSSD